MASFWQSALSCKPHSNENGVGLTHGRRLGLARAYVLQGDGDTRGQDCSEEWSQISGRNMRDELGMRPLSVLMRPEQIGLEYFKSGMPHGLRADF